MVELSTVVHIIVSSFQNNSSAVLCAWIVSGSDSMMNNIRQICSEIICTPYDFKTSGNLWYLFGTDINLSVAVQWLGRDAESLHDVWHSDVQFSHKCFENVVHNGLSVMEVSRARFNHLLEDVIPRNQLSDLLWDAFSSVVVFNSIEYPTVSKDILEEIKNQKAEQAMEWERIKMRKGWKLFPYSNETSGKIENSRACLTLSV